MPKPRIRQQRKHFVFSRKCANHKHIYTHIAIFQCCRLSILSTDTPDECAAKPQIAPTTIIFTHTHISTFSFCFPSARIQTKKQNQIEFYSITKTVQNNQFLCSNKKKHQQNSERDSSLIIMV